MLRWVLMITKLTSPGLGFVFLREPSHPLFGACGLAAHVWWCRVAGAVTEFLGPTSSSPYMVMCSGRAGASTTVVPRSRPPQVAPIRAPSTPVRRQEWGHMYRGLHPTPSTRGPAHCPHPSGYRHYHGTVAMKAPKRHVKSMGLD